MTNLTLKIDDELLRRARIKALEDGTSLTVQVRTYLEAYVNSGQRSDALLGFLEVARSADAGSGGTGRTWTRDDAYDR